MTSKFNHPCTPPSYVSGPGLSKLPTHDGMLLWVCSVCSRTWHHPAPSLRSDRNPLPYWKPVLWRDFAAKRIARSA